MHSSPSTLFFVYCARSIRSPLEITELLQNDQCPSAIHRLMNIFLTVMDCFASSHSILANFQADKYDFSWELGCELTFTCLKYD